MGTHLELTRCPANGQAFWRQNEPKYSWLRQSSGPSQSCEAGEFLLLTLEREDLGTHLRRWLRWEVAFPSSRAGLGGACAHTAFLHLRDQPGAR